MAVKRYRVAIVALPIILTLGMLAWFFSFAIGESDAQTTSLHTAVASEPEPDTAAGAQASPGPSAIEPLGRLSISRQSFARGGLGSKALVTFTLRNDNGFAIKDPEILCAFRSDDGYSTERRRKIADTVNRKSRKTYPYTLIGFVNVKASRAKCSLVTASRVVN